jgi:hypothetical protein
MVLGISLESFTLFHVLISLVGIVSGSVVMYGFLTNQRLDRWTAVFLFMTVLTSLTGLLFPFTAATPAIKLGISSLGGARYCHCDTLLPAPHLAENLRDCGVLRIVFQRFRSCSAVL